MNVQVEKQRGKKREAIVIGIRVIIVIIIIFFFVVVRIAHLQSRNTQISFLS